MNTCFFLLVCLFCFVLFFFFFVVLWPRLSRAADSSVRVFPSVCLSVCLSVCPSVYRHLRRGACPQDSDQFCMDFYQTPDITRIWVVIGQCCLWAISGKEKWPAWSLIKCKISIIWRVLVSRIQVIVLQGSLWNFGYISYMGSTRIGLYMDHISQGQVARRLL